MPTRYWFVGPLEASFDALPRFLARPIGAVIVLLYFQWKPLLILFVPTFVAGALGPALAYDLPLDESIPALLLIAGLLIVAYWQWGQVQRLRARLDDIEKELEENTEYE